LGWLRSLPLDSRGSGQEVCGPLLLVGKLESPGRFNTVGHWSMWRTRLSPAGGPVPECQVATFTSAVPVPVWQADTFPSAVPVPVGQVNTFPSAAPVPIGHADTFPSAVPVPVVSFREQILNSIGKNGPY
jgi:hypothetical protein